FSERRGRRRGDRIVTLSATPSLSGAKQTTLENKPERAPDDPLRPVPRVLPRRRPVPRRRGSTPVGGYPPPFAPRTGGAYDSHHRTAGIAGRTRRHGGGVAARGARAAAGQAADHRVLGLGHTFDRQSMGRRLCAADARTWLGGRSQFRDRGSLGRGT